MKEENTPFHKLSGHLIDTPIGKQQIMINNKRENDLLKMSKFLNFFRMECAQVSLMAQDRVVLSGKVIKGRPKKVGSFEIFYQEINRLVFLAKKLGMQFSSIEINHTHPTKQNLIFNEDKILWNLRPISKQDLSLIEKLRDHFSYSLNLKATTFEGINFSLCHD